MIYAEWAALIVPVVKRSIYVDYRVAVNQVVTPEIYPLPCREDPFAVLSSGKTFLKLDLAHAYQQVEVAEESRKYT